MGNGQPPVLFGAQCKCHSIGNRAFHHFHLSCVRRTNIQIQRKKERLGVQADQNTGCFKALHHTEKTYKNYNLNKDSSKVQPANQLVISRIHPVVFCLVVLLQLALAAALQQRQR